MHQDNYDKYIKDLKKIGLYDIGHCSIVTFAECTGLSISEAYKHLSKHGSRKHNLCTWNEWERALTSFQYKKTHKIKRFSRDNKITINQFVKKYPKGTYAVGVRNHVLTIRDGVVLDHSHKPRRRIFTATKFGD